VRPETRNLKPEELLREERDEGGNGEPQQPLDEEKQKSPETHFSDPAL
jgi:hypothetical protein